MWLFRIVFFGILLLSSSFASSATITVTATGNCPADPTSVQNAINSAMPGDTIQLLSGPSSLPFNFTCTQGGVAIIVQTITLTLQGTQQSGPAIIQGPGPAAGQAGFLIFSDDAIVTGIDLRGFSAAIIVTNSGFDQNGIGPMGVSIHHCRLENNGLGAVIIGASEHFRFTDNVIQVPLPPPASNSTNVGIALITDDSDLLIADNDLTGPGPSGLLTSLDQLLEGTAASEQALIQTIGIQQIDVAEPASIRGRISGNTLTGLDYGLQSSSNFGVVEQNMATNCEIGMALSNDTDDGIAQVKNSLISLNKSVHNQIGFVVFSGTQNTIALNDFSGNSLAGLFFVANPGGAPSVRNKYGCNQGTVRNAEGNQLIQACSKNAEGDQ